MTTTPDSRSDAEIERELTEQLAQLARRFIAGLQAQGRLVETGGAEALKRLQEQDEAQRGLPEEDQPAADVIEAAADPKPSAPALLRVIALPGNGLDTPPAPDTAASVPQPAVVPVAEQTPMIRPAAARTTSTEERGAADWTPAQARTAAVAAKLRAENAGRLETTHITWDHERVVIHIHALSLDHWEYWLTAIGAALDAPTHRAGWAQTAAGQIDAVDVHLTAYQVPHLLDTAAEAAGEPFFLGGRVYDLARGQVDRHGQTWSYLGQRREDGMPLLTLCGTSSPPYPLASIVTANGPLSAVETQTAEASSPDAEDTR
ncbi:BN159_2729 family protein [Streptomyces sp. NPDC001276]|uniref:BN159_2729 family protein n=1 Tax=Streptomyces sp. NPDC001276 TaxID=3364555 RepID=UPI003681C352